MRFISSLDMSEFMSGTDETSIDPIDLEGWRLELRLSYEKLAEHIGVSGASQAHKYASGALRPPPEILENIMRVTGGRVGPLQMHRTRMAWLKAHGRMRSRPFVPVSREVDSAPP